MTEKRSQTHRLRPKMVGVAGAAAFVTLGVVSLGHGYGSPDVTALAGSDDAPSNTTYAQPAGKSMNVGATATFTLPSSIEPVAKAVPNSGG
jgi:hypothetical protein